MTEYVKKLSPSRIDALNTCSWSYYCNYSLRLPDEGNDGAKRGSVIHDLCECLLHDRHKDKFEQILKNKDIYSNPIIKRFIEIKSNKYKLDLDKYVVDKAGSGLICNRDFVNAMTLVALANDFYGKDYDESISEKDHEIEYKDEEAGINFVIRGFIDKIFLKKDKDGKVKEIKIVDYKSSKSKFTGDKVTLNMQGVTYQLFAKDLYPEVENIVMEFLFLQFSRNPSVQVPAINDADTLNGILYYLSDVFNKINNFTLEDAKSNFAKFNGNHFLCGQKGKKTYRDKVTKAVIETDEDKWCCPYKEPLEYYAVKDKSGNVLRTYLDIGDVVLKDGEDLYEENYGGCPAWYSDESELNNIIGN